MIFFFSSRRRHTRFKCDWSSDVCSSDLREQNRTVQDIGLYAGDSVSLTGVAEPEQVRALRVTDGTLPLLGISPLLGRTFTKQDDSPGAPETAMLTYGHCRGKFRGDASLIALNIIL